jgi:flagellar biosynthetic protein FliR
VDLYPITLRDAQLFFLTFIRSGGVLFFTPLLDHRSLPVRFRLGLGFFLALIFFPILRAESFVPLQDPVHFALVVILELLVGLCIGLMALLTFAGIKFGAETAAFAMGFGIVSVFDPQSGGQSSVFTQFFDILTLLFFLSLNGHHWFLQALGESFRLLPPLGIWPSPALADLLLASAARFFLIGLQLAAPVLAAIFLAYVTLALLARAAPQMNAFTASFSVTIPLGFLALVAALPLMGVTIQAVFEQMARDLSLVVRSLSRAL